MSLRSWRVNPKPLGVPEGPLVADRSTYPIERVKEIKRRSRVVGVFPNETAPARIVSALLVEQTKKWQITRCYMSRESLANIAAAETNLLIGRTGGLPEIPEKRSYAT